MWKVKKYFFRIKAVRKIILDFCKGKAEKLEISYKKFVRYRQYK